VGRKRKHNKHLPRRVYVRRGKYYFAQPDGPWVPLGDDYGSALRAYAELVGEQPIGTLSDLFDRYAREIIPGKAPRTRKDQLAQLELLRIAFGHLKPSELIPRLVIRYRNARGQKSKTQANQELSLLSHACTTAVEWEVMESNPCRDVKKFKLAARDRYVEDQEFRIMRTIAGAKLRVLMDLIVQTGQREGDILALRWDQKERAGIRFQQGKTGKILIVQWTAALRKTWAQAAQLEPKGDFLVMNEDGKPYTTDGFQSLWRRARTKAIAAGFKRPFAFNDLRAKSASDDDLERSSKRLGHADTKITDRVYMRKPRVVTALNIGRGELFKTLAVSKPRKTSGETR
jgi:integrase